MPWVSSALVMANTLRMSSSTTRTFFSASSGLAFCATSLASSLETGAR